MHLVWSRPNQIKTKTLKYYQLKKDFDQLYKKEARKFLEKNIESLSSCNPGEAFKILKKIRQPSGKYL